MMVDKGRQFTEQEPNVTRYMRWLCESGKLDADNFNDLWSWSVNNIEDFWESIWSFYEVQASTPPESVLENRSMPGAVWFKGARLNFAEHIFRMADDKRPALVSVDELGESEAWTWSRLRAETASLAAYLKEVGVRPGDRVVGYLPNIPEAIVAFLAASSIGAVWSVCNLDVAVKGALARFRSLRPKVLIAADGCRFNGADHDRRQAIRELQGELVELQTTVVVPRLNNGGVTGEGQILWSEAIEKKVAPDYEQLPFDHPLWVLFSSGTTGAPKGIVHGHGGILLEELKFLGLHVDLGPQDCFFWYCSTSWVMWNVVVCSLLTGATAVLYDGSPNQPDAARLWQIAQDQSVTVLGVSPAYLQGCEKAGVRPAADYDLSSLRSIGCTGAPIPLAAYDWVRDEVGEQVPLDSVSGGTDVAGGFVGGCPILPVYPGENSGRCLGVAAEAWNVDGQAVIGEVGELVITEPMPSMPIYFWDDPDDRRYYDSYFDTYPGVWRHGDWITVTERGSVIVHGRSDATLNRQGVRLGSAEIYQAVEALPEIQESLVVGIELPDGDYWMPLFIQLQTGAELDGVLRQRIMTAIRESASPRHVPDEIIEVAGFPHTLTGKRLEVPIKRILLGTPVSDSLNLSAVDRPELVDIFAKLAVDREVYGTKRH